MFDHVTLRTSDRAASERFYETVLRTLGIERTYAGDDLVEWDDFSLAQATESQPPTRGLHIGFVAPSREEVAAFWRAGTEAGYRDDGAPARGRSTATTTTARSRWIPTATAPRS